jgi:glycosyltransferase involved in cell wall biosynthesis
LRVALFSDSYHEMNGVGTVCREFAAFAQRENLPFCRVNAGPATRVQQEGSVTSIELKRGIRIPLDKDLYCDPLLNRYRNRVMAEIEKFQPDLIHITGPGDMGVLGFWISNLLRVPMAASWHTNLHEYAGRRVKKTLGWEWAAALAERQSLRALLAFYRLAHFVVAPNQAMVDLLRERIRRPSYLMKHGVDAVRFSADFRVGNGHGPFCIGWVGRLTPEKNVRAFAQIDRCLRAAGESDFRLLLVGDGSESKWLRQRLPEAAMPGFLVGNELAQAFASMDAFIFPSQTDTFGLVVLEAMASGVPVLLTQAAGTRFGIQDRVEGFLSDNFCDGILTLMRGNGLRRQMGDAAAVFARTQGWSGVFEDLYATYEVALASPEVRERGKKRASY